MPETAPKLSDEQLLYFVTHRTDKLNLLSDEELKRARLLVSKKLDPSKGTREESAKRVEELKQAEPIEPGVLSGTPQPVQSVLESAASFGQGLSKLAFKTVIGASELAVDIITPEDTSRDLHVVPDRGVRLLTPADTDWKIKATQAFIETKGNAAEAMNAAARGLDFTLHLFTPQIPGVPEPKQVTVDKKVASQFIENIVKETWRDWTRVATDFETFVEEDPVFAGLALADVVAVGWGFKQLAKKAEQRAFRRTGVRGTVPKAEDVAEEAFDLARTNNSEKTVPAVARASQSMSDELSTAAHDAYAAGDAVTAEELAEQAKRVERIRKENLKRLEPQTKKQLKEMNDAPNPNPSNPESGFTRDELAGYLASSSVGGAIGAYVGTLDEDNPHPLAYGAAGAVLGAGGYKVLRSFMQDPAGFVAAAQTPLTGGPKREALGKILKGEPDGLADFGKAVVEPMLPDRIVSFRDIGQGGEMAAFMGGGLAGAVAGGYDPEQGFDPVMSALTGFAGAFGTQYLTRNLRAASGGFNPRKTFQRYFYQEAGMPAEIAAARRAMHDRLAGRTSDIMDQVRVLSKANERERSIIYEYMTGAIGLASVSEKYTNAAQRARYLLDELGLDLIEVGLAEGKAAETIVDNLGTYVPRLYLRYERGDDLLKVRNYFDSTGMPGHRLSRADYLKRRKDLPEEVREAYGEITDTAYLLGKRGTITAADVETARFFNRIAASDHMLGDDLVDAITRAAKEPKPGQRLIESGKVGGRGSIRPDDLFGGRTDIVDVTEAGAKPGRIFSRGGVEHIEYDGRIFRKVPNEKKFGSLAGKFVDENTALEVESMMHTASGLNRLLNQTTAVFKASKVTWNPATLMRNIYGQLPLNDLGGVRPWEVNVYREALGDYFNAGPLYREARKAGLFGGEFYKSEIGDLLAALDGPAGRSWGGAVSEWAGKIISKPFRKMERFHEASEQANKTVMYWHARNRLGMDVPDAVRYAKRYVFDYRELPRWVKFARKSVFGAPFISFSYKALPRVVESALAVGNPRQFMQFWKYPLAFAAANEASAEALGLQDSDVITALKDIGLNTIGLGTGVGNLGNDPGYQKYMADYIGAQQILLPYRDRFGRLQFWDLTWTLPWGDLGEVGKGQVGEVLGEMGIPFPRQLEPSNPFLQTAVAFMSRGRDPFTGKNIFPAGATAGENVIRGLRYVGRQYGPAWTGTGFSGEKLRRSFSGDVQTDPHTPGPVTAVLSELGGIKIRSQDPRTSGEFKVFKLEREVDEIQREINRLTRTGASGSLIAQRMKAKRAKEQELRELKREVAKTPPKPTELIEAERRQKIRQRKTARSALEEAAGL